MKRWNLLSVRLLIVLGSSIMIFSFALSRDEIGHDLAKTKILTLAKEAEKCFFDQMSAKSDHFPLLEQDKSGFTKMFLSEQLSLQILNRLKFPQKPVPLLTIPVKKFCQQFLVDPYLKAYSAAVEQRRERVSKSLAPLGSTPIEAENAFIEFEHNLIGIHNRGHADLTRSALLQSGADIRFSEIAVELVVRASQAPDLYKWEDEKYHAHTPWYSLQISEDRQEKIAKGKNDFVGLLITIMKLLQDQAENGGYDKALFLLGVSSHLIQDLVYHRGMTLQQHAGLYATRRNPDFPDGTLDKARKEEAVRRTISFINFVKKTLSEKAWDNMRMWTTNEKNMFLKITKKVFPEGQDIGVGPLANYVFLAGDYFLGKRTLKELDTYPACRANSGIACWEVEVVWTDFKNRFMGKS